MISISINCSWTLNIHSNASHCNAYVNQWIKWTCYMYMLWSCVLCEQHSFLKPLILAPLPNIYWYSVNVKIFSWPVEILHKSPCDHWKRIPGNPSASAVSYLYHSFLYRAAHRPRPLVGPILFSELCRPAITSDKAFKLLSWKNSKKNNCYIPFYSM